MSWAALKHRFRREAADKGLYRAYRALKKRGEVVDERVRGERYVALAFGKGREDRDLLALAGETHRQLRLVARARGLPESAVENALVGEDLDAYKPREFLSE